MDALHKLKDLALSDSGFVFDPYSGGTFSANATGLAILRGLKDGLGREALLARLRAEFELGLDDPARDLDEFLGVLRQNGLVPQEFSLER